MKGSLLGGQKKGLKNSVHGKIKKPHKSLTYKAFIFLNAVWTEQKFTLDQVKAWILENKPTQIVEVFEAEEEDQRLFELQEEVLFPELSEAHFEKCKLTYGQDYRIAANQFYYHGKGFHICPGEQLEIKYFTIKQ